MKRFFSEVAASVIDLFFPRVCPLCGRVLKREESGICFSCLHDLPYIRFRTRDDNPLARVFWGRVPFVGVYAYLLYEKGNKAARLIREIKYHGHKELGFLMGTHFGEYLRTFPAFQEVDVVVPVPLHRRKLRKRGFNQSEWIARGMAERLERPLLTGTLLRKVYNPTQTKRSRYQRWENVQGIFTLRDSSPLAGKHILLVDDVITTGATLEACAIPLLSLAGVRISLAALAMAKG